MTVAVRKATKQDARTVAEFAVALAGLHPQWNARRFTQLLTINGASAYYGERSTADNAAVLVAEREGRVIGFAYTEYEPVLYAELATRVAWLHDIYVEPDARNQGAGSALLAGVAEAARGFGASKVLLSVAANNDAGQRLFERNGFETTMHEMMLVVGE